MSLTRPIHGGYPDAAPEIRGLREMDERMISELVTEGYSLKRQVKSLRNGVLWRDERIRQLEAENENLHSRSEHAAQNAEALQEQVNVLREALEEVRTWDHRLPRTVQHKIDAALAQCAPEEVTP